MSDELSEYLRAKEPGKAELAGLWRVAIGLQKVEVICSFGKGTSRGTSKGASKHGGAEGRCTTPEGAQGRDVGIGYDAGAQAWRTAQLPREISYAVNRTRACRDDSAQFAALAHAEVPAHRKGAAFYARRAVGIIHANGNDEIMAGAMTKNRIQSDILEWTLPEEVLSVLLKDHSTGRNHECGKEAS